MNSVMTAKEMTPAISQTVLLTVEKMRILVTVTDVRFVWGKPQVCVSPISGEGSQWVELSRIRATEKDTDLQISAAPIASQA